MQTYIYNVQNWPLGFPYINKDDFAKDLLLENDFKIL